MVTLSMQEPSFTPKIAQIMKELNKSSKYKQDKKLATTYPIKDRKTED